MLTSGNRLLAALLTLLLVASCGPLIGAGAAVAVDEAEEREDGDDGLFWGAGTEIRSKPGAFASGFFLRAVGGVRRGAGT
jgi:hypothetical protein